jgi:hypothetical protein
MAAAPSDKAMVVAAATTFVLLALGALLLRMHCDLTLGMTGFERTVCEGRSTFGVYALLLVALPVGTLIAGSISRRTGWPFVFYAAWTTSALFGFAVIGFPLWG